MSILISGSYTFIADRFFMRQSICLKEKIYSIIMEGKCMKRGALLNDTEYIWV